MVKGLGIRSFFMLMSICVIGKCLYAQTHSCIAKKSCNSEGVISQALLNAKYYNQDSLLVREIDYNIDDSTNHTYKTYTYLNNLLVFQFDSNRYQKKKYTYTYKNKLLLKVVELNLLLTTENVTPRPSPLDDSLFINTQPKIIYVWNADTTFKEFKYNKEGLISRIIYKRSDESNPYSETFEYDKNSRLIKATFSDQYYFSFTYDNSNKLIKKEKFENHYVDDSSIGPYFKTEEERLKKASWKLSFVIQHKYNALGLLIEQTTQNIIGYPLKVSEIFTYDVKNRLISVNQIEGNNSTTDCVINYYYSIKK